MQEYDPHSNYVSFAVHRATTWSRLQVRIIWRRMSTYLHYTPQDCQIKYFDGTMASRTGGRSLSYYTIAAMLNRNANHKHTHHIRHSNGNAPERLAIPTI